MLWLAVQAFGGAQCVVSVIVGVSLSLLKGCTYVIQCDVLLRLWCLYGSELLAGGQ